jgi:hypothetical protein
VVRRGQSHRRNRGLGTLRWHQEQGGHGLKLTLVTGQVRVTETLLLHCSCSAPQHGPWGEVDTAIDFGHHLQRKTLLTVATASSLAPGVAAWWHCGCHCCPMTTSLGHIAGLACPGCREHALESTDGLKSHKPVQMEVSPETSVAFVTLFSLFYY